VEEAPRASYRGLLELQRAYGNRRVARWVLSRQPVAPALADTATGDNRALAKEIDEIRKLDTQALYKRHAEVEAALAAGPTGAELERLSRVRDAIDFVRAERIKGNWTPPYPGHDTNSAAQLRGAALREIQHHGSVDYGLDAFDKRFKNSDEADRQSRRLVAEKDTFAKQFTSQARQNADKILAESQQSIYALMRDYGLPRRTSSWTEDSDKFKGLADEWMTLAKTVDDYRSEYYSDAAVTHRKRLAQWVKHLQKKQGPGAPRRRDGEVRRRRSLRHEARAGHGAQRARGGLAPGGEAAPDPGRLPPGQGARVGQPLGDRRRGRRRPCAACCCARCRPWPTSRRPGAGSAPASSAR
jgi:hypothetical protein